MQGKPGDKTIYEYKDKNRLATIINTYDNDNKATLSLLGTEDIIKTDNDFEDIISPGGGGSAKNILSGIDAPSADIGSNGDIYLQHFDYSSKGVLSYLCTNNKTINIELSNWIYRTSDKLILKFKNAGAHSGNWGRFITATDLSILAINYNLWSGRAALNIRRNGTYSGDGAYLFDSPSNTTKYYQLILEENGVEMLSGSERDNYTFTEFVSVFGTVSDADTTSPVLFGADTSAVNVEFHELAVYRNGVLIHDYMPVSNGIKDVIDNTMFTVTDSDVTYGSALTNDKIFNAYCKVDGAWQLLEETDIDDVNTGE